MSAHALEIIIDNANVYSGEKVLIETTQSGTPQPPPDPVCNPVGIDVLTGALSAGTTQYNFNQGQAYALSLTGQQGDTGSLTYGTGIRAGNGYTVKLATLSACAGQFAIDQISPRCAIAGYEGSLYYKFDTNQAAGYCTLDPSKTYYLSIRNWDTATEQDTCPPGQSCGFVLTFDPQ